VRSRWCRLPTRSGAFSRARWLPGGERLQEQGNELASPLIVRLFAGVDRRWGEDFMEIVTYAVGMLMGQAGNGEIAVDEILPALERVVFRLTADPVSAKSHARRHAR